MLSDNEVKCLCAHMCFWGQGLATAMQDCGMNLSLSDAATELLKRKWFYDEETDSIHWTGIDPSPSKIFILG